MDAFDVPVDPYAMRYQLGHEKQIPAESEHPENLLLQNALEDVVKRHFFKLPLLDIEPNIGFPTEYNIQLVMRTQFLVTPEDPKYCKWVATIVENMVTSGEVCVDKLNQGPYTHFSLKMWLLISDVKNVYDLGPNRELFINKLFEYVASELNDELKNAMFYMLCKVLLACRSEIAYDLLANCVVLSAEDPKIVRYLFKYFADLLTTLDIDKRRGSPGLSAKAKKCINELIACSPDSRIQNERVQFFKARDYPFISIDVEQYPKIL